MARREKEVSFMIEEFRPCKTQSLQLSSSQFGSCVMKMCTKVSLSLPWYSNSDTSIVV